MPSNGALDAPAKVNLTLEILARRSDGYHGLRSVMLPVALCDTLRWEPAAEFSFGCDAAALGGDNLVVRAFDALGVRPRLRVTLEKRIPWGAGLGGGSSDAAAVLRAAMRGDFGYVGTPDWLALARTLGSDVPFFLAESGALVEGTGERVTALGALPPWWVVLVMPAATVSTAAAYTALDTARAEGAVQRPRSDSSSLRALEAVQRGDLHAALDAAGNDFEPVVAALEPAVRTTLDALAVTGARAFLSGSGAACFALAETEADARAIDAALALPGGARSYVVALHRTPVWR